MEDIKRIDQSKYVTVQGRYAVINEGTGYAIIDIQTKQMIAHNISSFLDCVKTMEYIASKNEVTDQSPNLEPPQNQHQHKTPKFNVREDVQHIIEMYAPTTVRVEKKVTGNRSR